MTQPRVPIGGRRFRRGSLLIIGGLILASLGIFLVGSQLVHKSSRAIVVAAGKHGVLAEPANASPSTSSSIARVHSVVFIGASYTWGLGATPNTDGYAYLVGRDPGWISRVYGVVGTGFMNPGPHNEGTLSDRIDDVPAEPHPDVVVFQAGRNDTSYPADKERAAAIATANLAHKHFGNVVVVFLGPVPAHVPAPADQLSVASSLRSAAAVTKSVFIDPIQQGWITPSNEDGFIGAVPAHPNNAGHAYIAQHVLADLNAIIRARAT